MNIGALLLASLILFVIIYFAVRLAIDPLINKPSEIIKDNKDLGLSVLRDIEILNDTELKEVIELYQNKSIGKEGYEQYQKYIKVLNELKEMGYFTDAQHSNKVDKLKKYFKAN